MTRPAHARGVADTLGDPKRLSEEICCLHEIEVENSLHRDVVRDGPCEWRVDREGQIQSPRLVLGPGRVPEVSLRQTDGRQGMRTKLVDLEFLGSDEGVARETEPSRSVACDGARARDVGEDPRTRLRS